LQHLRVAQIQGVLFVFYDNFVKLCNSINKAPSTVAEEMGIHRSTVTRWKQGKSQTDLYKQKVADYFGIPVDELMGEKEKSTGNADGLSEEEIKFIEWYRSQASDKEKALVRMIVEGDR
jgi:transcriptional regulator with XRE-family HTH domain